MKKGKPLEEPTADELDAEMDAYNKAAATGAVAAERQDRSSIPTPRPRACRRFDDDSKPFSLRFAPSGGLSRVVAEERRS